MLLSGKPHMNRINSLSEHSIKESTLETGQLGDSGDGVTIISDIQSLKDSPGTLGGKTGGKF